VYGILKGSIKSISWYQKECQYPYKNILEAKRMQEKRVLNVKEVAEALTLSTKTVYKMLHENKLPYIVAGDKYLIPCSAFERYLLNAGCQAADK